MKKPNYSIHRSVAPARPRRRRLRSLAFVPTLVTLGNLLCGFAAIHFALRAMVDLGMGVGPDVIDRIDRSLLERMLPSFLSVGAGLIFLGMILDAMDGLIARATQGTSNFGGQLDSLADVVTFGVAPATLMVAFMTRELAGDLIVPSPISPHFLGRATWIAGAFYVVFAAVRLARFNVEHAEVGFDYKTFRGLPSPAAAGLMAALILISDQLEGAVATRVIVFALPVAALFVAFLMVSRVPYRRLNRSYLLGRQPFGQLVFCIAFLAVFLTFKAFTLVAVLMWYVFSGPVGLLTRSLSQKRSPSAGTIRTEAPSPTERKRA